MQGPAAGGETGAEASVGAAQTGAAQGGGDGSTPAFRPGDGAPQEAAEAGGGQGGDDCCYQGCGNLLFVYFQVSLDCNSASKFAISFFFIFKYEQQEIRQRENQQKIPEFVRVKDNLRRTQTPEQ